MESKTLFGLVFRKDGERMTDGDGGAYLAIHRGSRAELLTEGPVYHVILIKYEVTCL